MLPPPIAPHEIGERAEKSGSRYVPVGGNFGVFRVLGLEKSISVKLRVFNTHEYSDSRYHYFPHKHCLFLHKDKEVSRTGNPKES